MRMPGARLHHHGLLTCHVAAQAVSHRHDDGVGHSRLNRGRRHVERHKCCAATGVHCDAVPGFPSEVFGHRLGVVHDGLGKGVAGDESVHITQLETCVAHGIQRDLNAKFPGTFIGDNANVTLGHAD